MCAILCIYFKAILQISKQKELGERCYKDHEYAWALLSYYAVTHVYTIIVEALH